MNHFILKSYLLLLRIEWLLQFRSLQSIHDLVASRRVDEAKKVGERTSIAICRAVDLACVFYPKQVFCLQRSAVTVLLLRRYGVRAEMVIGAQILPFKSHAWAEVDGIVVNDKPYMPEIYRPLERC